jgi:hypothetical protein
MPICGGARRVDEPGPRGGGGGKRGMRSGEAPLGPGWGRQAPSVAEGSRQARRVGAVRAVCARRVGGYRRFRAEALALGAGLRRHVQNVLFDFVGQGGAEGEARPNVGGGSLRQLLLQLRNQLGASLLQALHIFDDRVVVNGIRDAHVFAQLHGFLQDGCQGSAATQEAVDAEETCLGLSLLLPGFAN